MHPRWQEFLDNQSAELTPPGVTGFGMATSERPNPSQGILCDLSHEGWITVEGTDALTFLQGQLTQDLRKVSATYSPLAAYCSAKGRVLVVMRLFHSPQGYGLRLPAICLENTLKRLTMYTLRAHVTLRDSSHTQAIFGVAGEKALPVLRQWAGELPQDTDTAKTVGEVQLVRLGGSVPRFLCRGDPSALASAWQTLVPSLSLVGIATWEWLAVQAGLPRIVPETSDKFVPQMLNLDKLNAISFTKGCYVGQEIVARSQYLGEVKRRLSLLHGTGTPPQPGDRVYSQTLAQEHIVGDIVRTAAVPGGEFVALAVINNDAARHLLLDGDLPVTRS